MIHVTLFFFFQRVSYTIAGMGLLTKIRMVKYLYASVYDGKYLLF